MVILRKSHPVMICAFHLLYTAFIANPPSFRGHMGQAHRQITLRLNDIKSLHRSFRQLWQPWVQDAPASWKRDGFLEHNAPVGITMRYGQNQHIRVTNSTDIEHANWQDDRDYTHIYQLSFSLATHLRSVSLYIISLCDINGFYISVTSLLTNGKKSPPSVFNGITLSYMINQTTMSHGRKLILQTCLSSTTMVLRSMFTTVMDFGSPGANPFAFNLVGFFSISTRYMKSFRAQRMHMVMSKMRFLSLSTLLHSQSSLVTSNLPPSCLLFLTE